jgi:hypothetical protein
MNKPTDDFLDDAMWLRGRLHTVTKTADRMVIALEHFGWPRGHDLLEWIETNPQRILPGGKLR